MWKTWSLFCYNIFLICLVGRSKIPWLETGMLCETGMKVVWIPTCFFQEVFQQTDGVLLLFLEVYTTVTTELEFIVCFETGRFLSSSSHLWPFPWYFPSPSISGMISLFNEVHFPPHLSTGGTLRKVLFLFLSSFFLVLFSFYQQHFLSSPLWFPSREINSLVSYKLNTITAIKTGVFLSL